MKEYECEEYEKLVNQIADYILRNITTSETGIKSLSRDILDIVKYKSSFINEKLKEDNERLTIKMINIENATKGYFRMIERVMNAEN